jgi:hypothetical protein
MGHTLHSLARATPKTRAEIRTQRKLMKCHNVSKATMIKWHKREEDTKLWKTVRIGRTLRAARASRPSLPAYLR